MPPKQRTSSQTTDMASETLTCIKCSKTFTDPDSKLLECQRCKDLYCTNAWVKPRLNMIYLVSRTLCGFVGEKFKNT